MYALRIFLGKVFRSLAGMIEPEALYAYSVDEIAIGASRIGYPVMLRPSFALGSWGGRLVRTQAEIEAAAHEALQASPTGEVLVQEAA